ncbi:MAG: YjbQ family protein [Anaerolineae bacterium]|nr:MAG: YjbQ family protein [Anaerolineae bacterium]
MQLRTRGNGDIHDITGGVTEAVQASGLNNGIVTVFVQGSTGAVSTVEYEPGLVADLRDYFDRAVPSDIPYQHDRRWHDGNGHSHVRATLLGPSLTVPFVQGRLTLGTWQQIIFVDFDVRPRDRTLIVQVMGE